LISISIPHVQGYQAQVDAELTGTELTGVEFIDAAALTGERR
jgi:hypothetical protein